jgi:predicted RNase H-like HicB family nuclease
LATGYGFKSHQELSMSRRYTVSDGKLVLNLEEAEEGGYIVTSPLDPELIAEAETLEEAFANARDAAKALKQSRARLMRQLELAASKKPG